jgi:hypothetical protein
MGSRYAFIVLYVWLEHHLSRGDYRRKDIPPAGGRHKTHEHAPVALRPSDHGKAGSASSYRG